MFAKDEPPVVMAVPTEPTPLPVPVHTVPVQAGDWNAGESFREEKQQKRTCKDWPFAILFLVNVGAIAVVAGKYGLDSFSDELKKDSDANYVGFFKGAVVCGIFGLVLSAVLLMILVKIPKIMIKASIFVQISLAIFWVIVSIVVKQFFVATIAGIFLAITLCYARAVWSRIPFATANLKTACKAVNSNCGINIIAYFMVFLAFGWSMLWTIALSGVWDQTYTCEDRVDNNGNVKNTCQVNNFGYVFLIFLSYFFTHQVLQNALHATVAGVVGTWWFIPDEGKGCCSTAVIGSWFRSCTSSLGSICFGSLLVAIVQALRALANSAQNDGDGNNCLICIAQCILSLLESILEYFNKWAFVYVGLYGYGYIEAGKNVMQLFQDRGWEAIIADDLVSNCLGLSSLLVGGLTGCCGLILKERVDWFENSGGSSNAVSAFIIGFVVGLVLCSILLSVIGSAVNAVIVCFADGPQEFEAHYPELSNQMRVAWAEVYPDVPVAVGR